jgi:hypothetical protein
MHKLVEIELDTDWSKCRKVKIQGQFLKGPISLDDIATASRLPGQALGVFLAVHHRAALTRCKSVTLPKGLLERLGIGRDAKGRALHALEAASLIVVERDTGKTARITLVDQESAMFSAPC